MMKPAALFVAVMLAVQATDRKPAEVHPVEHPTRTMTTFHPGLPNQGGPVSVYDDAIAVWTFNEPDDLGADALGTYDLTEVNVPTATGGALGYAAEFNGTTQYASIADNASFDPGSTGPALIFWMRPSDLSGYQEWVTDDSHPTASGRAFNIYTSNAAASVDFFQTNATFQTASIGTMTAGTRHMVAAWWDTSDGKAHGSLDNGTVNDSAGTLTGIQNSVGDKRIAAAYATPGSFGAGTIGPVLWYSTPPTAGVRTSLYNSGKGKTCADLTAAEQTNLVSCWDMDEDGGPYADSVGSNDLTAVNAPARVAGLVEQARSGMGMQSDDTAYFANETAGISDFGPQPDDDYTIVAWINPASSYTGGIFYVGTGTPWGGSQIGIGDVGAGNYFNCSAARTGSTPTNSATSVSIVSGWDMYVCKYTDSDRKVRVLRRGAGSTWTVAANALSIDMDTVGDCLTAGAGDCANAARADGAGRAKNADNVAVWRRALSDADIDELWAEGAGKFYGE